MHTMDKEKTIYSYYRMIPSRKIIYFGRFFHCLRIERITKSYLFSRSWIDSSAKNQRTPDFYNDKFHMMMEFMRIDDCIEKINGKKINNSFAKANIGAKKLLGNNYKKEMSGLLMYLPDTNDSKEFNYHGYINNFERVVLDHSSKVPQYRENHPKCKTTILFVCDESNNYVQVANKDDLCKEDDKNPILNGYKPHFQFNDSRFIEIIKKVQADYVIWFGFAKCLYNNGKKIKYPQVAIYDVNHIKYKGVDYNEELMFKVKNEVY